MTAADKYREAVELYRTTDLTLGEIASQCGVTRSGLAVYIQRNHRDLLLQRNGMEGETQQRVRPREGQNLATHNKYRDAIEACDSEEYIDLNISQIARMFNLSGPALANQLRAHYPDIIPRREAARHRRGIADNTPRGARPVATETYAKAVTLLRETDMTVEEVADTCGVSYTGLRQHIIFYHKDIARLRDMKRQNGKDKPEIGRIAGNGRIREMSDATKQKYALGVELYRTTSLPITEISKRIDVNVNSFRYHLRTWYKPLISNRRSKK